ncbi:MAG: Dehydrogenase [Gemmatimonadetes bacterium]|nr:Dehydrogenase [Gemmatimonadota bacterium]
MQSIELTSAARALGLLADPAQGHAPVALGSRPPEALVAMLRSMMLIRAAENGIAELVRTGEARCPCHLAAGQEACAVGVAAALDTPRDKSFGAHRSHGHYLAVGGDLDALLAEVLGKETGCSHGMGGSMHLVSPEHGLLGTVPIVGATIPIATGAALAARLDGSGGVSVSFFGDGATEEGVFHESMNLAATMALPVLFVCENNLFSSHLHISLRQPDWSTARYAEAHKVAWEVVDGNDVVAVADAAERAVARGRAGHGPTFLELVTYRWYGHVGPRDDQDVGVKRDGELPLWKRRDPIRRLEEALVASGALEPGDVASLRQAVDADVERAVELARRAPYPQADATAKYLYTGGTR